MGELVPFKVADPDAHLCSYIRHEYLALCASLRQFHSVKFLQVTLCIEGAAHFAEELCEKLPGYACHYHSRDKIHFFILKNTDESATYTPRYHVYEKDQTLAFDVDFTISNSVDSYAYRDPKTNQPTIKYVGESRAELTP